jgi:hypothetical protein
VARVRLLGLKNPIPPVRSFASFVPELQSVAVVPGQRTELSLEERSKPSTTTEIIRSVPIRLFARCREKNGARAPVEPQPVLKLLPQFSFHLALVGQPHSPGAAPRDTGRIDEQAKSAHRFSFSEDDLDLVWPFAACGPGLFALGFHFQCSW